MALRPFIDDPFLRSSDRWLDHWHRRMRDIDPWIPRRNLLDYGMGISSYRLREFLQMPRLDRMDELMREAEKEFKRFTTTTGKDGFQVNVDVQQFKPYEVTVRTLDNSVVIEGKHEERQDNHGFVSRQFCRRYTLPSGYDANKITSSLSSDGILTIKAPPPRNALKFGNERFIQIQQTGPARYSIKQN